MINEKRKIGFRNFELAVTTNCAIQAIDILHRPKEPIHRQKYHSLIHQTNIRMDHSDDELPASHPARRREFGSKHERTNRNRGGWGEAMELAHQRSNDAGASSVAAVDLNQFRNTEVGTGYQAKHVVRQKTAEPTVTKTRIVNSNFQSGADRNSESSQAKAIETDELLRNDGLRAFRKEIESILSS